MAAAQVGDRALDRREHLVVGDRQAVLAQAPRDRLRADVAAVGEQHQRAPRRADPREHLDSARLGAPAAVGAAMHERPVDVEHEAADIIQPQAVKHGARPPSRRF